MGSFFGNYGDKTKNEPVPMEDETLSESASQGTPPASPAKKNAAAAKPAPGSPFLEMDSLNDNSCMPIILQVFFFF